jgi:hypothetical protein
MRKGRERRRSLLKQSEDLGEQLLRIEGWFGELKRDQRRRYGLQNHRPCLGSSGF